MVKLFSFIKTSVSVKHKVFSEKQISASGQRKAFSVLLILFPIFCFLSTNLFAQVNTAWVRRYNDGTDFWMRSIVNEKESFNDNKRALDSLNCRFVGNWP
ncbi:MAG: hypothetical protein N2748_01480, partial [candidate division WOR-3 bacterium]|nr:hypothetical protein [candidate division WOR-3 bacterium]